MRISHRLALGGALLLAAFAGCQSQPSPPQAASTPLRGPAIDAPAASPTPLSNPSGDPSNPRALKVAPTDPAERAALAVEAPAPAVRDGFSSVTFSQLSDFVYQADMNGKLTPESTLPQEVSALDDTNVALSGFLVPIEFQGDKVSSLILVRNQLLCCFGEEPKLNEWVFVNADPPVDAVMEVPVTLYGKFYASPDREEGQIISLYRMQAEDMEAMR